MMFPFSSLALETKALLTMRSHRSGQSGFGVGICLSAARMAAAHSALIPGCSGSRTTP